MFALRTYFTSERSMIQMAKDNVYQLVTSKNKILDMSFSEIREATLTLLLDQGYWEDSHLTLPSEDVPIEDIDKTRQLGNNGLRKHQKTEDERFLYWRDVKGMPIWSEMAAAYSYNDDDGKWGYGNKVNTEEEFFVRFNSITTAIKQLSYCCGYCYTQVSDVQQEANGLMTIDRKFKVNPDRVREINLRAASVCHRR